MREIIEKLVAEREIWGEKRRDRDRDRGEQSISRHGEINDISKEKKGDEGR